MKFKRLLIIEDDPTTKTALFRALTKIGYSITTATTKAEANTWITSQAEWDIILLDLQLPDGNGMELISEVKKRNAAIPVIVLTGHASVDTAIEATQKGAFNLLLKPSSLDEITHNLSAALTATSPSLSSSAIIANTNLNSTSTEISTFIKKTGIVGQSPEIQQVLDLSMRVAESDATILIQGESGTGKELVARAIHQLSSRRNFPFIAINCGAIPSELLESELFGHMKGAFTGAISNRVGRFEMADGGVLFLDEIGDMSPSLQVKILRALQERSFEPVGSTKSIQVNVQVIAATHVNLEKAVAEGKFREDLYYRLNVVPIFIPALRERKTDIPVLTQHFIHNFSQKRKGNISGFSNEALECLMNYPWPGNIRELENLIERLTIIKGKGLVELKDLPVKYHTKSSVSIPAESATPHFELPIEGLDFNSAVDQFENNLIIKALEKTGWNRNQAAMLLKLNRTTLVEKMKKKGLRPPPGDANVSSDGESFTAPMKDFSL